MAAVFRAWPRAVGRRCRRWPLPASRRPPADDAPPDGQPLRQSGRLSAPGGAGNGGVAAAIPAENDGEAGAQAGVDDDNVTGEFLGQKFSLVAQPPQARRGRRAGAWPIWPGRACNSSSPTCPAGALLNAADSPAGGQCADLQRRRAATIFCARSHCRANVIHVAPTRSMLADALAQYLVWKQWRKWLLVVGSHPEDRLLADALRRAATRFGAKIVEERVFKDTGGARRTDSGVVQIQQQMPVFTQERAAYDVLVAADESEVFAGYLPYRTWDPRPVAGSAGLRADRLGRRPSSNGARRNCRAGSRASSRAA